MRLTLFQDAGWALNRRKTDPSLTGAHRNLRAALGASFAMAVYQLVTYLRQYAR